MSTLLYSLGRWSYRHAWRVLVSWLLLLAVVGGAVGIGIATGAIKGFDNSFSIPGTEGQEGIQLLNRTFPQASGTSAQYIVVAADGDRIDEQPYTDEIAATITELSDLDGVLAVTDPFSDM
ncbi:MAG TPA: MMPL family transporter, partial [Microbacterium sp.]|nr:MMPL family transporter [Microbacterium sp.]